MRKCLLFLLGLMFVLPVFLILSGTVLSRYELKEMMMPLVSGTEAFMHWKFFPQYPTFEHYVRVLFYTPQFFVVFWNSVKIAAVILAGQLILADRKSVV